MLFIKEGTMAQVSHSGTYGRSCSANFAARSEAAGDAVDDGVYFVTKLTWFGVAAINVIISGLDC